MNTIPTIHAVPDNRRSEDKESGRSTEDDVLPYAVLPPHPLVGDVMKVLSSLFRLYQDPRPELSPGLNPYAVAVALAALAGWVDAISLSCWHGLFVSFMSGNSTALGTLISGLKWQGILRLLGIITGFISGVVMGEVVFHTPGSRPYSRVLILEAILLGVATITSDTPIRLTPTAMILALAMGMQNAAVHRAGGISVALTYVTGTLVHFGRSIAAAFTGTSQWTDGLPYLGLWAGLVVGAALGALMVSLGPGMAIGIAAFAALFLAFLPPTKPS